MRNLKVLGLALVAVLAMSAFAAAAAQAQNTILTPEGGKASTIEGEQLTGTKHNFRVGSREFTCEKVNFRGEIAGNTETLTVTAEYAECMTKPVLGVSFPATVTMNSCDFLFHGKPTAANGTFETQQTIVCTKAGDRIEIDLYKVGSVHEPKNHVCTLTIAPQTASGTNQIHNKEGKPDDLLLTTAITLNVTIHGTICGEKAGGTENEEAASYTGETTIRAKQAGAFVNLTASHT